jgi:hypothetical protein
LEQPVFVGHFAIGLAAKRIAPKVSLSTAILAAAFSDVVWILCFVTGIEKVKIHPGLMVANSLDLIYIPFSHSLLMDAVWGAIFAALYYGWRRDSRGAWILFAAVVSPLDPGCRDASPRYASKSRTRHALWTGPLEFSRCDLFRRRWLVGCVRGFVREGHPGNDARRNLRVLDNDRVAHGSLDSEPGGSPPPSLASLAIVNAVFFAVVLSWAQWMNGSRVKAVPGSD